MQFLKSINLHKKIKKTSFYFLLILLYFSFQSCEQNSLPTPSEGEVEFSSQITIGSEQLAIEAGKQGYEMVTGFEMDDQGVYWFEGNLEQKDCAPDCGAKLQILLSDISQNNGGTFDIEQSISIGERKYVSSIPDPEEVMYVLQAQDESPGQNLDMVWQFSDSTVSSPVISLTVMGEQPATTSLLVTDGIQSWELFHYMDPVHDALNCPGSFEVDYSGTLATLIASPDITVLDWFFLNGDTIQQTANVITVIPNSDPQASIICMAATHVSGCTKTYCNYVPAFTSPPPASIIVGDVIPFDYNLEQVIINYIDKNGNKYSTLHIGEENDGHVFHIESTELFMSNENGEPTLKIEASGSCFLANENDLSDKVLFSNMSLVFAVAYPE